MFYPKLKTKKSKLTVSIFVILNATLISSSQAAIIDSRDVPISPVISTGSTKTYTEEQPNLWFLLDDSGSMGLTCRGYESSNRCKRNFYYFGYIGYDPAMRYELPKNILGGDMPLPDFPTTEEESIVYTHPFVDNANAITDSNFSTTDLASDEGENVQRTGTRYDRWGRPYSYTYTVWVPDWKFRYDDLGSQCWSLRAESDEKKHNCLVWQNYYSSRMKVLKSSISLSFIYGDIAEKTEMLRIGYISLNKNAGEGKILPVLPLSGVDKEQHRSEFNQWLYRLTATGGTPLRGRMSKMYGKIISGSNNKDSENPFLYLPNEPFNNRTNPLKNCRRNFGVILTDGSWNTSRNNTVETNLSTTAYINNTTTETTTTLPDEVQYQPMAPYAKKVIPLSGGVSVRTIADIAFAGWKTDMDNSSINNDMGAKHSKVDGEIQKLNGSSYWHPHNDEANWQHINTFTIGFNLEGNLSVNPPKDGVGGLGSPFTDVGREWDITVKDDSHNSSNLMGQIKDSDTAKDLANAALASRGRFYNATTADDLKDAFNDIVETASLGGEKAGIRGSAGAVGVSQNMGSAHFSSSYDIKSFTGELTRTNLYDGDPSESAKQDCFDPVPAVTLFGQLCTNKDKSVKSASSQLAANTSRSIISLKRMNGTIEFDKTDYKNGIADISRLENSFGFKQINFSASTMNPAMKDRLKSNAPAILSDLITGTWDQRIEELVKYVKGNGDYEGVDKFRVREFDKGEGMERNIMGAIMRTSPVFSGVPRVSSLNPESNTPKLINFLHRYMYDSNGLSMSADASTAIAKENVNMVYVGSNGGMLHALRADTLDELFAYVPNAVYDNLSKIVDPDEKQLLVDGGINVKTVNIIDPNDASSSTWKQILAGALGGGGKGVYALDVTDPAAANIAMWEYSDFESKRYQKLLTVNSTIDFKDYKSNIGNIIGKPSTVQLSDGTWVVMVGNGYNAESGKAALIAINANTGQPIQELVIDNDYTDNDYPNGLGPLYFVGYPDKAKLVANRVDRAYAGDLQGNLWVFDLTNATKDGGITIAKQENDNSGKPSPLFVAKYTENGNEIKQPITVAPLVKHHPSNFGYLVHFGTGSLFTQDDESSKIKNSVYAIWDDWVPENNGGLTDAKASNFLVQRDHLREVEFRNLSGEELQTRDGKTVTARILKGLPNIPKIKWAYTGNTYGVGKRRGWYVDLLLGERAWQTPTIGYGKNDVTSVNYVSVRYNREDGIDTGLKCSTKASGVSSYPMSFNDSDGSQPLRSYGARDANGDGEISSSDMIETTDSAGNIIYVPATGIIVKNDVILSSQSQSIGGPQPNLEPSEEGILENPFCNYQADIIDSMSQDDPKLVRVCRKSMSGSWSELK